MSRRLFGILFFCSMAICRVMADYSLPDVQERLVLLLDLKDVKLDKHGFVFSADKAEHRFTVDRFWMQDRIWSDGICSGIQESDPKSSASRIREVQLALAQKKDSLLLVELVRVAETSHFFVTYLKLFDPEKEYKRYFSGKTVPDTIRLPLSDTKPKDAKGFVEELNKTTEESKSRIGKLKSFITKPS
ncbi:hypothetical protein P0Y35_12235 [Kiritimatiellaeota bacterium B1221]|nr:hypothetical protein [Kiritimatiellaeota bacterium B1221]